VRTNAVASRARLLGAALLLAAGCGGSSQATPSGNLRTNLGDIPPDMRSDYESFASNCSKCHGLERALAAPVTDNRHWDVYVAKMMRTAGSAINASEAPHILRFLYWYTDQRKPGGSNAPESGNPSAPAPYEAPKSAPEPAAPTTAVPDTSPPAPAPSVTGETQGESAQ
jgi:hypothetical protein